MLAEEPHGRLIWFGVIRGHRAGCDAIIIAHATDARQPDDRVSAGSRILHVRAGAGFAVRHPDYTCLETVERTEQSGANRSRVEDTLRLEVALVEGKEMFAWPGSRQFEDRELRDLVSTGMFGNGNFAVYARILFLTNLAVFEYQGEADFNGRPAVVYRFRVPRSANAHRLRVNEREAVVGFHGSFYADSDSLDIRRVEVVAEDIPEEL